MANDTTTPGGRIAAAIHGLPQTAVCEVHAADVQAVAQAVATPTAVTAALAKGAAGSLKNLPPDRAAALTFHVTVSDLAALLGAAGVNAQ